VREHVGARIADAVDAVAESHQPLAAIELRADHVVGALGRADLEDHVERRPRRAAVQRPFEGPDGAGDGRDDVGPGRDDHACGERRRVEPVIADGVQIRLERACALTRRIAAENLMEEMRGMRKVGPHGRRRFAVHHAPVAADDRRKRGNRGHRLVERIGGALQRQEPGRHAQRVHWRGLRVGGFAEDVQCSGRQRAPRRQIFGEPRALPRLGQRAMKQQVRHFLERGVRRKVLDRVAGNGEPPGFPIHMTELRRRRHDTFEAFGHASIVDRRHKYCQC